MIKGVNRIVNKSNDMGLKWHTLYASLFLSVYKGVCDICVCVCVCVCVIVTFINYLGNLGNCLRILWVGPSLGW